jgi:hypothetical protein
MTNDKLGREATRRTGLSTGDHESHTKTRRHQARVKSTDQLHADPRFNLSSVICHLVHVDAGPLPAPAGGELALALPERGAVQHPHAPEGGAIVVFAEGMFLQALLDDFPVDAV